MLYPAKSYIAIMQPPGFLQSTYTILYNLLGGFYRKVLDENLKMIKKILDNSEMNSKHINSEHLLHVLHHLHTCITIKKALIRHPGREFLISEYSYFTQKNQKGVYM